MRFVFALMIMAVLLTGPVMAQDLTSDKGKLSYAVGWDIGQDIQRRGAEFDVDTIVAAIRDAAAGRDPQVASEEMVALLTELQQKVRQEQAAAFQKLAEENQAMSEEFLNSNLSKNGIVELPSGVQYRIIDEGEGARPGMESTVKVHYRGSKINGHEFEVWLATTTEERQLGLMNVSADELADTPDGAKRGMLFVFANEAPRSFWMLDTPTALDIAFMAADGTIVKDGVLLADNSSGSATTSDSRCIC